MQTRTKASLTVVSGAVLGTLAAFMGGGPAHPPGTLRGPVGSIAPRASHAAVVTPAPEGSESATPTRAHESPPTEAALPEQAPPTSSAEASSELDRLAPKELELRCAHQKPDACLAAARAYETGRAGKADPTRARLHFSLAVSLLDRQCTGRDPGACRELAELFDTGKGVERNPSTATALRKRALGLCEGRDDAICSRLRAPLLR